MSTQNNYQDVVVKPRDRHHDLHIDLPQNWYDNDPAISHFFDGMSILFPEGERVFIHGVRSFKDQVTDPVLRDQVRGFIAQEAIHGREHEVYNELLAERGLPAKTLERHFLAIVKRAYKAPPKFILAGTCAAEHFTAMMANQLLSNPDITDKMHPVYRDIWTWHAIEETEHKAVAYDVYSQVAPGFGGYVRRIFAYLIVSLVMNLRFLYNMTGLMIGAGEVWNFKSWGRLLRFQWGKTGFFRKMIPEWLAYLKPSFHPWDHDNREYIESWNKQDQTAVLPAA